MMHKKSLKVLLSLFFIFVILISDINSVYALGEYRYIRLASNDTFFKSESKIATIQTACIAYCYWDRIINLMQNSEYVSIADGVSDFELKDYKLHAKQTNDYNITIDGPIQIKTKQKYTVKQAAKLGLIDAGFTPGSNSNYTCYFKIIQVNKDIQL